MDEQTAVWWIRRDLRLTDNQALTLAMQQAKNVLPLFIIDPFFEASPYVAEKRRQFLWAGLRALDADLRQRGSRLLVRHGDPLAVLQQVMTETAVSHIVAEADYTSYARRRDQQIGAQLPLTLCEGLIVHHPNTVLKKDGTPYTVFTPFKKHAWLKRPLPHKNQLFPAPKQINTPEHLHSEPIPESQPTTFVAGESDAQQRLTQFVDAKILDYKTDRDMVGLPGTSQLSPYLRFGMISARQAVVAALSAISRAPTENGRLGAETWLSELIWREFYTTILYHFPHVLQGSFRPEYDQIAWHNDSDEFAAWCNGRTGYPIVDAAMHQLNQTGWMHNRARMIVASFLIKDLLIDWRWGERYFMQQLIDGDPAANNGGWQWTAGTGTDAAPYFRIFNPISQSKKFDPDGEYIRHWLPELSHVDRKYIHAPWEMPPLEQMRTNCKIGTDYPSPIIDHKFARERTLAAYKVVKK